MTKFVAGSKGELEYLKRIAPYRDQMVKDHPDSPQEGFEYFTSEDYRYSHGGGHNLMVEKFVSGGLKMAFGMIKLFAKQMPKMIKGRRECFTDLKPYLDEIETTGTLLKKEHPLLATQPNFDIWEKLSNYAWDKWQIRIGFTEMPEQFVFKGKTILFRYAIVCIQEMKKSEIDQAPEISAGTEVIRVYKELGLAVNDLARWLREKYNVHCQSNHPLGGLTNTTPLAGKAGLGWQGRNGLLITPWYGQRQRIAPIFIEEKLFEFTDSAQHKWIEDFCQNCGRCERSCPTGAIYSEKRVSAENVPGIGVTRTCIDRIKCFPRFNATMGCSICVKVCPFSQGDGIYDQLKAAHLKRLQN